MFHPLMSSSAVWSSQISLHFCCPKEQQYSIDLRMALKSSLSGVEGVTSLKGVQDELAGQDVRFLRKEVGQGQLSMAMQAQASLAYCMSRGMSLQLLRGLHRLKQLLMMGVGAVAFLEQACSLLKPSLMTSAQFWLCIWQFLVTIWKNTPRSKFCLLRQQQMGAEAAWAASTRNGYFILIQVASMPPQDPPNTTTGQSEQQVFLMKRRNSTKSIRASSVVRQTRFSLVQELFWSPKGMLTPKYRCSGQIRRPCSSFTTTSLQKPVFLQNISMGPSLPQYIRIGPLLDLFQLVVSMRYFCLKVLPESLQLQWETFWSKVRVWMPNC